MISTLAKMLRLNDEQAEASMFSEGAARAVLGRRNLMLAGAALVAGTAFSFGHSVMSQREFCDLIRSTLPGRDVSVGPGRDIWRDGPGDAALVTATISGTAGKSSQLTVDLRDCDSSFAREKLRSAVLRHGNFSELVRGPRQNAA